MERPGVRWWTGAERRARAGLRPSGEDLRDRSGLHFTWIRSSASHTRAFTSQLHQSCVHNIHVSHEGWEEINARLQLYLYETRSADQSSYTVHQMFTSPPSSSHKQCCEPDHTGSVSVLFSALTAPCLLSDDSLSICDPGYKAAQIIRGEMFEFRTSDWDLVISLRPWDPSVRGDMWDYAGVFIKRNVRTRSVSILSGLFVLTVGLRRMMCVWWSVCRRWGPHLLRCLLIKGPDSIVCVFIMIFGFII